MGPLRPSRVRVRSPLWRAATLGAWVGSLLLAAAPSGAAGADVDETEPALCAEAVANADGEPLDALAEAERTHWRAARRAQKEARRLLHGTVGLGASTRSAAAAARAGEAERRFAESVARARVLCGCRQQRGDPDRPDCDALYRRWLPPRPGRSAPR